MKSIKFLKGLALMSAVGCCGAHAADVSGLISTNTQWTTANAPYRVTGALEVAVTATLDIQPGVTVHVDPGVAISVRGRVLARGTQAAPIVFTSSREAAGSGSPPQPGDWGTLTFGPETIAGSSQFTFAQIRYGSGVVLEGDQKPEFSNVRLDHHAGPALRMDLDSRPFGAGLSAVGNTINGIVVPAGNVQSGHFRLRGIPYVLESGLIRVGQSAVTLSAASADIQLGGSTTLTLGLSEPAPAGGLTASLVAPSTPPGALGVPATVHIPAAATETQFAVQGLVLGSGTVTADVPGRGSDQAYLTVRDLPQLDLGASDGEFVVALGRTRSMGVQRGASAPSGGVAVALSIDPASVITVPASVQISQGNTGASFNVSGAQLGTTTLTATANGHQPATRQIRVRPLSLSWATTPMIVPPGSSQVILRLSDPAPAGGLTVALSSADTAIVTVPATTSVPAGASQVPVTVTGLVEAETTLTASTTTGYEPATSAIHVERIDLSFDPPSGSIPQGLDEPFTVRASKPAPAGGLTVQLSSSEPKNVALLNTSVLIPAGQTSAPVSVDVRGVLVGAAAIITAQSPGTVAAELPVTVTGAPVLLWSTAALDLGHGLRTESLLSVRVESDAAPFRSRRTRHFTLTSTDATRVFAPAQVTLLADALSAFVPLSGVALTPAGTPVEVTVSAEAYASALLPVQVVRPTLNFSGLDGEQSLADGRIPFRLEWTVPGSAPGAQVAVQQQLIDLSLIDVQPAGIVTALYRDPQDGPVLTQRSIGAGNWQSGVAYVGAASAGGSYRVRASTPVGAFDSSLQQVVVQGLAFSHAQEVVGRGLRSTAVRVQRLRNGQPFASPGTLIVQLSTSDASRVQVPATLLFEAGSSEAVLPITGLATAAKVEVQATVGSGGGSTGYSAASPLRVSVIEPELRLRDLDGNRVIGGTLDSFGIHWQVNGAVGNGLQAAMTAHEVGLSVVNANPPGIVAGFTNGLAAVTSVTIPANGYGAAALVTSPTVTGSYQVQATLTATPAISVLSATQQVVNNGLTLQLSGTSDPITSVGLGVEVEVGLLKSPSSPVLVQLTSTPAGVLEHPATLELTPGNFSQRVMVAGQALGSATLQVSSTAPAIEPAAMELSVVERVWEFVRGAPNELLGQFASPGNAAEDLNVRFEVIEAQPDGAAVIYENAERIITRGQNSTNFGTFPQGWTRLFYPHDGTYRVRAHVPPLGVFDSPVYEAVEGPGPSHYFPVNPIRVGTGLISRDAYFSLQLGGLSIYPTPYSAELSCSDPKVCVAESPITVTEGNGRIHVRGLVPGQATVDVDSGPLGGGSANVVVEAAELSSAFFSGAFTVGAFGFLDVRIGIPGVSCQESAATLTLAVSSTHTGQIEPLPATVEIAAGSCSVGLPLRALAPGDFTITLAAPGVASHTTATITVLP